MASRGNSIPHFAKPPTEYSNLYMADIIRSFSLFAQAVTNPGEGRNTTLVLTEIPTNGSGLEVGSVYRDGNVLKIVIGNVAALNGYQMTLGLGDVTVTVA